MAASLLYCVETRMRPGSFGSVTLPKSLRNVHSVFALHGALVAGQHLSFLLPSMVLLSESCVPVWA